MPVIIHAAPARDLTPAEIDRWRGVPVAVAVDLGRDVGQIDPAIRPLRPPGRQPRLFGRAVTALCEPPDFGAVLHALDLVEPGDVLAIAAAGHAETAMIGEILGGYLRRRGCRGLVCDGAVRDVATLAGWDDFAVFARWITPRVNPKRFDTRFLVGRVPAGQDAVVDGTETVSHEWLTPHDALEAYQAGRIQLIPPTVLTLDDLARFPSVDAVLADARRRVVCARQPEIETGDGLPAMSYPDNTGAGNLNGGDTFP